MIRRRMGLVGVTLIVLHVILVGFVAGYIVRCNSIQKNALYRVQFAAESYEAEDDGYQLFSLFFEQRDALGSNADSTLTRSGMSLKISQVESKCGSAESDDSDGSDDSFGSLSYAYSTELTGNVNTTSRETETDIILYGGDFCGIHFGSVLGSDVMNNCVLINDTLSFLLFGSSSSEGMELELNGVKYEVLGVVDDGQEEPYLYISWNMFVRDMDEYGVYASGAELCVTCLELLIPEEYDGQAADIVEKVFKAEDNGISCVNNTGRFGVWRILSGFFERDEARYQEMDSEVWYPYWEINALRLSTSLARWVIRNFTAAILLILADIIYIIIFEKQKKSVFDSKQKI